MIDRAKVEELIDEIAGLSRAAALNSCGGYCGMSKREESEYDFAKQALLDYVAPTLELVHHDSKEPGARHILKDL